MVLKPIDTNVVVSVCVDCLAPLVGGLASGWFTLFPCKTGSVLPLSLYALLAKNRTLSKIILH